MKRKKRKREKRQMGSNPGKKELRNQKLLVLYDQLKNTE